MSLHFTLAKKILSHAKDLLKHIFNEHGADIKHAEQELLAAVKAEASSQLEKLEASVETKLGSKLQHWQRAPQAENATSVHAPADLSFDDKEDEDADEGESDKEGEKAGEKEGEDVQPAPSDSPSDAPVDSASNGTADGEKEDTTPGSNTATYPAGENADLGNSFDHQAALDAAPARVQPTEQPEPPTEQSGAFHGDAMPASGVSSETLAESGKDGGAATGADLPKEQTENEDVEPSETSETVESEEKTDDKPDDSMPLGGTDAAVADETKAEQEDVPALNGELDIDKDKPDAVNEKEDKAAERP